MAGRGIRRSFQPGDTLPPLPVDQELWDRMVGHLRLSPKRATAAEMLLRGLTYDEIAAVMNIGFRTVRDHLECVAQRLGVQDSTEIILGFFAVSHQLLRQ